MYVLVSKCVCVCVYVCVCFSMHVCVCKEKEKCVKLYRVYTIIKIFYVLMSNNKKKDSEFGGVRKRRNVLKYIMFNTVFYSLFIYTPLLTHMFIIIKTFIGIGKECLK